MADVVDDDTTAAVIAAWRADAGGLDALSPPVSGRVKSTQGGADMQAKGTYTVVECVQGPRPNERFITGPGTQVRNDYRKVTLTVRGVRADVVAAVGLILALFNRTLGAPKRPTLTYPSGARFVRWWPLGDGEISEDKDTKAGKDVWQGVVSGEVWSIRTEP